MKQILSLLICLLLIISVAGCNSPYDVHHASNGNIDPQGEAKRSEVAVLLYLFCKNVLK
jgi:hypothetical protein